MSWNCSHGLIGLLMGLASLAASAQTLLMYTSNGPKSVETVTTALRAKYPSIQVKPVTGGTGTLMKRLKSESTNPVGDLFWSGGVSTLSAFPDLMESYRSPEAKAIAPQFRDLNGRYVGVNVHVMVLAVNEKLLNGLSPPATWSDLMKPEWRGKVVIADPAKSGSGFLQVYGLLKQFGQDGLEKIAANVKVIPSSDQIAAVLARGDYPVGITLETVPYELVEAGQKDIRVVYPTEGTYLGPEAMFIIKGAKNAEAAKQFYDLLLSKEVQEKQLTENRRRPTRTDIAVSKLSSMPELIDIKVFPLNSNQAHEDYEQLIALWNIALGKTAPEKNKR